MIQDPTYMVLHVIAVLADEVTISGAGSGRVTAPHISITHVVSSIVPHVLSQAWGAVSLQSSVLALMLIVIVQSQPLKRYEEKKGMYVYTTYSFLLQEVEFIHCTADSESLDHLASFI